jgi:hypothetical protein
MLATGIVIRIGSVWWWRFLIERFMRSILPMFLGGSA